jgi:DNA (cytosine-5)-methyltransferase 1
MKNSIHITKYAEAVRADFAQRGVRLEFPEGGMRFGSVCSGIEAASVAWHPMGWQASFLSEIEPFPRSVLAHHYPDVPLHGDFTTITRGQYDAIDVLVGGTPCQSFSVAGLRKGLDDPRGNLMLGYLALADKYRPDWLVWENVPGVLSSNGGRDFGTFLGGLGQLGYGFAYRVLDAQHFGVPQRRRRVFVVGCLGDWRRAAAVLFERHSLQGHPAPRRQAGERVAGTLAAGAHPGGHNGQDDDGKFLVAHTLRGEGFDASEDGTGRGTPLVPVHTTGAGFWQEGFGTLRGRAQDSHENLIAFSSKDYGNDAQFDIAPTLRSMNADKSHANGGGQMAVAIQAGALRENPNSGPDGIGVQSNVAYTLEARAEVQAAMTPAMQVRRLTPIECERLQGFKRNYTLVPHRGKPAADGPRYKALGNSMAVPVMAWIGQRIELVSGIEKMEAAA